MSQSNMNGFIGEPDPVFGAVFTESMSAEEFLRERLPKHLDNLWFTSDSGEWCQIVNKNGRLWIEVGEGAA